MPTLYGTDAHIIAEYNGMLASPANVIHIIIVGLAECRRVRIAANSPVDTVAVSNCRDFCVSISAILIEISRIYTNSFFQVLIEISRINTNSILKFCLCIGHLAAAAWRPRGRTGANVSAASPTSSPHQPCSRMEARRGRTGANINAAFPSALLTTASPAFARGQPHGGPPQQLALGRQQVHRPARRLGGCSRGARGGGFGRVCLGPCYLDLGHLGCGRGGGRGCGRGGGRRRVPGERTVSVSTGDTRRVWYFL
mmetsp:Transcript_3378/g.8081  ORF Transcript_3378/g.8081 Transcript_3378/m.8081 type:complete len:254 (-) Transcript_3378:640-1401(-)